MMESISTYANVIAFVKSETSIFNVFSPEVTEVSSRLYTPSAPLVQVTVIAPDPKVPNAQSAKDIEVPVVDFNLISPLGALALSKFGSDPTDNVISTFVVAAPLFAATAVAFNVISAHNDKDINDIINKIFIFIKLRFRICSFYFLKIMSYICYI